MKSRKNSQDFYGVDTSKLALKLSWLTAGILILLPFHAFLTVWLSSGIGHYTVLRLWKEFLLIILMSGALYLLAKDRQLREKFFVSRLTQITAIYCLVSLALAAAAYGLHKVTLKALGYGLIVNLRFLVFFLAVWIIAAKSPWLKQVWLKLLLIPATAVIFFGLLQRIILPYDVLRHFGYSENTIFPYETINHNINYPRIMSTLRGANPLGAYLTVVISAGAVLLARTKNNRRVFAVFGLMGLLALFFSYSRGAWLGAAFGLILVVWQIVRSQRIRRRLLVGLITLLVICGGLAFSLRHNSAFQNAFLHTQNNSSAKESSNQGHISAFRSGLHDATLQPLGQGVGTAGPASVYNNGKTRLAENYFIQIAQEVGWLGLILFLAINFLLGRELWRRRAEALPLILFASLAGLTLVNFFSHAWTDDTLSYLWWGLAGAALAPLQPLTASYLPFTKRTRSIAKKKLKRYD